MDHHGRRAFAGQRRRRFIKSAVEEASRRAGGAPDRPNCARGVISSAGTTIQRTSARWIAIAW
jgi:hypothetical protein